MEIVVVNKSSQIPGSRASGSVGGGDEEKHSKSKVSRPTLVLKALARAKVFGETSILAHAVARPPSRPRSARRPPNAPNNFSLKKHETNIISGEDFVNNNRKITKETTRNTRKFKDYIQE